MSTEKHQELEAALAHHERQLQDLSDIIIAQGKEIERLKLHITRAEERFDEYIETAQENEGLSASEIAARDKPPHY